QASVMRPSQRLAVDGNLFDTQGFGQGLHPTAKARLESRRLDAGKQSPEGIGGGNTIGQFQERLQPSFLLPSVNGDLPPGLAATDGPTNGNHDDVDQLVASPSPQAGVGDIGKIVNDRQG